MTKVPACKESINSCMIMSHSLSMYITEFICPDKGRARKLYTSARIYEWKFGKGEWKLPFSSLTGRVDFFGFVIIFKENKFSLLKEGLPSLKNSTCTLYVGVTSKIGYFFLHYTKTTS